LSVASTTGVADGVRVTVDPFTDPVRCGEYFDLPKAYANGLAILFVSIQNTSSDQSLLLERSAVRLLISSSPAAPGGRASVANGEATAVFGASIGSPLLVMWGGAKASRAAMIQNNLVSKELKNDTLAPNQSASGFLYFQLDKTVLMRDGAVLEVDVARPLSPSVSTVRVPISRP